MAGYHDLIEFMDDLFDEDELRLPKKYIRDRENPMEFYSDGEFYRRYSIKWNFAHYQHRRGQ
jgi:hypothetical protein